MCGGGALGGGGQAFFARGQAMGVGLRKLDERGVQIDRRRVDMGVLGAVGVMVGG